MAHALPPVASMSLLEVIRGVVSHEINVGTNGELS